MELKQLEYLSVCAQTKSFTKAANTLFTAQSNVSKVIKSLEKELGFKLFERKQYGIALTEKGKTVYEYAQATLSSAQKIKEYSKSRHYELRISTNPSKFLSKIFCDYYQQEQDEQVHYSIITASTNEIIERIAGEKDQLGFIYVMEEQLPLLKTKLQREHLFYTPLKRTQSMLYTGELAKGENIDDIALVQGYDDEFTLRSYWNTEQGMKIGVPQNRIAVSTNSDYVMSLLLQNTKLGNISGGYLGQDMPDRFDGVSLYGEKEPVLFGYITRNDRPLDKLSVQFLKYIKNVLTESQDIPKSDS